MTMPDLQMEKVKHFSSQENDDIFHIFDQIKVSRVPL